MAARNWHPDFGAEGEREYPGEVIVIKTYMRAPSERVTARFHPDAGFLLCNLLSEHTGVEGAVLWIAAGEPTSNESALGARVLVVVGQKLTVDSLSGAVSVTLTVPPEVLGTLPHEVALKAVEFVERNRDVLGEYWRGEMGTGVAMDLLVRV
jgi:hypothetical protein